jgi:hypothetical protein
MADATPDAVVFGLTNRGARFRPSDWNERLAGLTSAFGQDHKLTYSPLVRPMDVDGVTALIVGGELAAAEPRLWQFLTQFARDNDLVVTRIEGALARPHEIAVPSIARGGEPREPV